MYVKCFQLTILDFLSLLLTTGQHSLRSRLPLSQVPVDISCFCKLVSFFYFLNHIILPITTLFLQSNLVRYNHIIMLLFRFPIMHYIYLQFRLYNLKCVYQQIVTYHHTSHSIEHNKGWTDQVYRISSFVQT